MSKDPNNTLQQKWWIAFILVLKGTLISLQGKCRIHNTINSSLILTTSDTDMISSPVSFWFGMSRGDSLNGFMHNAIKMDWAL